MKPIPISLPSPFIATVRRSLDALLYQINERKAGFINQILKGTVTDAWSKTSATRRRILRK